MRSTRRPAATIDRLLKKTIYAEAGIGRYLLADPDHESISLRLFRLDGPRYVVHAFAARRDPDNG
jgi:hypothetical protein